MALRWLGPLAVCLAASSASGIAAAQGSGTAAAEALFQAGRKAMNEGDHDAACKYFRESSRLDRTVGTLYNLADCEERRGNIATAWQLFGEVVGRLSRSDERREIAVSRRDGLAPRLPKIVLRAPEDPPSDLRVKIGEVEFRQSAFGVKIPVDPGPRTVRVIAAGREDNEISIDIAEGGADEVVAEPGPVIPEPEPEVVPEPAEDVVADAPPPPVEEPSSTNQTIGFIAGGVGIAGLAAGGVFGILAMNKEQENHDNCFPDEGYCNQAGLDAGDASKRFALVSTIGFVVGGVGLATGAYFLLFTDDSGTEAAMVARPRAEGATLELHTRF